MIRSELYSPSTDPSHLLLILIPLSCVLGIVAKECQITLPKNENQLRLVQTAKGEVDLAATAAQFQPIDLMEAPLTLVSKYSRIALEDAGKPAKLNDDIIRVVYGATKLATDARNKTDSSNLGVAGDYLKMVQEIKPLPKNLRDMVGRADANVINQQKILQ